MVGVGNLDSNLGSYFIFYNDGGDFFFEKWENRCNGYC
jgi:hypothetical protein